MNLSDTVNFPSSTELCCYSQPGKNNIAKQNRKAKSGLRKSAPGEIVHLAIRKLPSRKGQTSRNVVKFLRKQYLSLDDEDTGASFGIVLRNKITTAAEIPVLTRCFFCFPLSTGLMAFAYLNLLLTLVTTVIMILYITTVRASSHMEEIQGELPRRIFETFSKVAEFCMTLMFVLALHRKHLKLMKVYLCFEVVYSIIGLIYSLACFRAETAGQLFLMLFDFRSSTLQIYLVFLVWSLIVKMEREDKTKYTEKDTIA